MADYTPPNETEAIIISAAEILTALTEPEEGHNPSDRRAIFSSELRNLAGSVRNSRNRRAIEQILSEDTSPFAAVVRNIGFHGDDEGNGSQRYQIQLEDDQGEIEYISTARADNDSTAVEQLVGELEDARNHRVLIFKHMEQGKDGRKFRSLVHFQIIGGTVDSAHDDLEDQLDTHIESIGKKKGR